VPYWMEDSTIRAEYEETLKGEGVANRMEPALYHKPAAADAAD
jgi:hypothetical protein